MAIEVSNEPQAFAEFENRSWNEISAAYDRNFGRLTRQSTPAMLTAAKADTGCGLLDVCTGPGVLAAAAVQMDARVIALDFSAAALAIASRLLPSAACCQGDAQALPFADGCFDAAVCGFGIIHLPDPRRALEEMYRVLRPGGCAAVSVWQMPAPDNGFGVVYESIRAQGNLKVPLPHGPDFFQFGDSSKLAQALGDCGFIEPSIDLVKQFWRFEHAADFVDAMADSTVRTRGLLAAQNSIERNRIRQAIESDLARFRDAAGGYRVPMPALVGAGMK